MEPVWARHLPRGVDPSEVDLLERRSLPGAWASRWATAPDAPVLHDAMRGWVSASWLEQSSRRVAGRLLRAGLARGDRVVLSATSSVDLVVAHVACLRAGLVVVPTNTGYRAREITHIVTDAAPRAAVVDDGERGVWIRDADASVLVIDPAVALPDADAGTLDDLAADDPALIGYTSGTTGTPKGAVLSHGNLLSSAEALRIAWRWTEHDRLVLCLPLFHMHGLGVGLHGTLLSGASAVLQPGFDVNGVLDAAREHAATMFFGVPTMYARLPGSSRARELARLRLCVSGSAPLSAELHRAVEEASGQRVLERYGMTETVMLVSNPYDGERRPGTVGFPLPGVKLRLDTTGEILVRGPNVFAGYWRRPEATAESFSDGWFRTADLGAIDDDGYLTIAGRAKELVISGGYNVYPREVEDVLLSHPAVADAAVTGTPSVEWGEVVTAWVVPSAGSLDTDAVLAFAAEHLASYKRPRIVHVVDELPRNALGKVLKHELR